MDRDYINYRGIGCTSAKIASKLAFCNRFVLYLYNIGFGSA